MTQHTVELGEGARWPQGRDGRILIRKLRRVAAQIRRTILITSGDRNAREAWEARMDYLQGGILAALCCDQAGWHTWADCGREPHSNHARGRAADCVIVRRNGEHRNIGESRHARAAMHSNHLCLPVGAGETWHVEVGTTWRS